MTKFAHDQVTFHASLEYTKLSRNFHRLNFQHCGKPLVLLKLKKNEWLSKLDYMLYFKTIFTYYVFRFTSFFYKYLGDDLIVATDKKAMEIF